MGNFKIGDKVIVADEDNNFYGLVGVVEGIKGDFYCVKFKHHDEVFMKETSIELIDVDDDSFEEYMKTKKLDEEIKRRFGVDVPECEVEEYDAVNHPSHYTSDPSGVECIDITKYRDFCVGNAIKYLWRAGLKHDADKSTKDKQIEDLKKAIWYINKEIELLEGKQ